MALNPANILTLMRLILAPFFIVLFWSGEYGLALTAFIVAATTDMVDGTIARLCGSSSKFGARLDPIADKLLMQGAVISLLIVEVIPLWLFLIILARDILVVSGIIYLEVKKFTFAYDPSWVSKFTTLIQACLAGFGIVLFGGLGPTWPWSWIWPLMVSLTTVFTLMSIVVYFSRGMDILKQSSSQKNT